MDNIADLDMSYASRMWTCLLGARSTLRGKEIKPTLSEGVRQGLTVTLTSTLTRTNSVESKVLYVSTGLTARQEHHFLEKTSISWMEKDARERDHLKVTLEHSSHIRKNRYLCESPDLKIETPLSIIPTAPADLLRSVLPPEA